LTLSVGLLLLGILETFKLKQTNIFIFFGKCSLVFYVIHLFFLSLTKRFFGGLVSADYSNFAIFKVYLIWIILLTVMYFVCSFYKNFKLIKQSKSLKGSLLGITNQDSTS
jgi:peptidoglycan/LPS O-acetylase OafA/YrhL